MSGRAALRDHHRYRSDGNARLVNGSLTSHDLSRYSYSSLNSFMSPLKGFVLPQFRALFMYRSLPAKHTFANQQSIINDTENWGGTFKFCRTDSRDRFTL